MYTHAVLRIPGPDCAQGLTTAALGAPDHALLLQQHAAYAETLRSLGLEVTLLEPLPGYPDAYFVEDVAVVTPQVAVITRPGAPARRGEAGFIAPALEAHRPLAHIQPPGVLEGGDVLVVGQQVFIGLSERTNPDGAAQLERILAPCGYTCTTVPVGAGLHLKSGVNWLGGDWLLLDERFASRDEFAGYRRITVLPEESYAANVLWVNGGLLVPAGFPRTLERLAPLGLRLIEVQVSEARKMDGGLTCMSLRF